MFVDGVRRSSALITGPTTIHLGAADGIPVSLVPGDPTEATAVVPSVEADVDDDEKWEELAETDPDVARAGGAVASPILADLRKLEAVASNAARNARGAPSVVLALSSVRRAYNDLMLRAARSPSATLGQRLYGARLRAELSIDEAANAAGVPTAVVQDAESERPVPPGAAAAIETLIAQLAMS